MRNLLVCAFLLAAVGCNPPDVGAAAGELTLVSGRCTSVHLGLYDGLNYTGNRLCYSGTGTAFLPSGWPGNVQSFIAGQYRVTFYNPSPVNACYLPYTNVSNTNSTVEGAWAVTRTVWPPPGVDAGWPPPPPPCP